MRKLIFIIFFIPLFTFGQVLTSQMSFNTIANLRATTGTSNNQVLLNGLTTVNDGNGGVYTWNSASSATDDGFITIKPTPVNGAGRWIRIGNGNTIKGSTTFSATLLTSTYTVPLGVTLPFVPITVLIQPRSSNAAVPSWVSTITNSNFVVNFASVPILGTNNITIDWVVIKQ